MTARSVVSTLALAIAFLLTIGIVTARAQSAEVEAANQAFYAALSTFDIGAMDKVWAHEPYVFYVGPSSKTANVGWPAVQAAWHASLQASMASLAARIITPGQMQIRINGDTAWVTGTEEGTGTRKDGGPYKVQAFVTNVFEKKDGRWLMVSHHAQSIPQ